MDELTSKLTDIWLMNAIEGCRSDYESGYINSPLTKELANEIATQYKMPYTDALTVAISSIWKEAGTRWLKIQLNL